MKKKILIRITNIILLNLLMLGFTITCKSITSNKKNNAYDKITIEETSCGSYSVRNNDQIMGYAVKPFVIKVNRLREITEFERKLKIKFKNKFTKDYRIYSFTKDWTGDTILNTFFFTSKLIKENPNWKCEVQDVETYWPKKNTDFGSKVAEWVTYNCSKNRFKVPGDPD